MKIAVLFTKRDAMAESYHGDWEGRDTNDDAESVMRALRELGHEVKVYHVDIDLFEKLKSDKEIDVAFNLCDDGIFSNPILEPHLPAMLEVLGIAYTGCDYLSLALCLNKARAKKLLAYHDVPTPRFQVFRTGKEKMRKTLRFPLIVKPVHEDASIGIKDESVVRDERGMRAMVEHVLKEYRQPALVEEFIEGREFNVGIVGDKILPISEITFEGLPSDKPRIVNYAAKWKEDSVDYKHTVRVCPAKIDEPMQKMLSSLAVKAANLMLCRDYCRVDFRVDQKGKPFVLEVNPNPDISENAGLNAMAAAGGFGYKNIIEIIVNCAAKRKEKRE